MRTALQTNKMVIISASTVVAEGLTFTVGQITWTTHDDGLTTTTLEEDQIRPKAAEVVVPTTSTATTSAPTTLSVTPTTHPPPLCYKGKRVDNSDLLEAIDRANRKLSEASDLVNTISSQITWMAPPNRRESLRPTRVTTHERLGTSLAITTTPEGRSVRFKVAPPNGGFPLGLSNAADQVVRFARQLLGAMDLSPRQPARPVRHFISVVSIRTLPEGNTANTNSSTGSVPTEVLHSEDESYDLDLLPYPPGFPDSRFFRLDEETWSSTSLTTNQSSMEKPMIKDSSVRSATLIALSGGRKKNRDS